MHTRNYSNTRFHFDQDLSDRVVIRDIRTGEEMGVFGPDLVEFILDHLRDREISKLEGMSKGELLSHFTKNYVHFY